MYMDVMHGKGHLGLDFSTAAGPGWMANRRAASSADPAESWLKRIAGKELAAMDQFYSHFQSRVYRLAWARLGDYAAAADVLDAVMLSVWTEPQLYTSASSVRIGLLMQTCRRLRALPLLALRSNSTPEGRSEPRHLLQTAGDVARVVEILRSLPQEQGLALHLALFEDLSYREIAEVTDATVGSAQRRVIEALEGFRACMAPADFHLTPVRESALIACLNGSAGEAERACVQQAMLQTQSLSAEQQFLQLLRRSLRMSGDATPADFGFDRLREEIAVYERAQRRRGLTRRLRVWLRWIALRS